MRFGDNRARQRMSGEMGDGRGESQHAVFGLFFECRDPRDEERAFGERAGFIESKLGRAREILDSDAATKQNAATRGGGNRNKNGGRHRENKGAGRRDDEHCHGAVKRVCHRTLQDEQSREDNRAEGKREPRIPAAERIGEALRGRLLLLGRFDERKDAAERAFLERACGADDALAIDVQRAAADEIAELFRNRNCFAGQRRFIHGRRAVDQNAVNGQKLAGFDEELVASRDLLDGNFNPAFSIAP